jgi:hypothetical protein
MMPVMKTKKPTRADRDADAELRAVLKAAFDGGRQVAALQESEAQDAKERLIEVVRELGLREALGPERLLRFARALQSAYGRVLSWEIEAILRGDEATPAELLRRHLANEATDPEKA